MRPLPARERGSARFERIESKEELCSVFDTQMEGIRGVPLRFDFNFTYLVGLGFFFFEKYIISKFSLTNIRCRLLDIIYILRLESFDLLSYSRRLFHQPCTLLLALRTVLFINWDKYNVILVAYWHKHFEVSIVQFIFLIRKIINSYATFCTSNFGMRFYSLKPFCYFYTKVCNPNLIYNIWE